MHFDAAAEAAKPGGNPALKELAVMADRKGYGADLVQAGSFRPPNG